MATNKTNLVLYDYSEAEAPFSGQIVTSFDVYQDAIDYVETFLQDAVSLGVSAYVTIWLYSNDNTSYRYYLNNTTITKLEIVFPRLIT